MLQGLLNYLQIARESVTKAWKSIDVDHANIHDGKSFVAFHKASVAAGQTLVFSFKTPETGEVHYRQAGINPSSDKVDTAIYEGADINVAGTEINIQNKNRNSTATSGVELKHGTTFTDNGTLLPGFSSWLPGSTGIGQSRSGDSFAAQSEIALKANTVYRFVLTNGSSGENVVGINFRWYEE